MNSDSFSNNFLVVSPPSQYINLTAGETYAGTISVAGISNESEAVEFFVSIIPYGVNAGDYTVDFSPNSAYNDIVNWISVDTEHGVLMPNEAKEINYTINVPENAPAGGQYCAIAIRNAGDDTENIVNDIIEIASVIYARVEGDVVESGKLTSYSVPSIVLTPPITSSFTFQNDGNVHLNASINTKITNYFGDEVIYDSREQKETITETIMPGAMRVANYTFDDMPELGVLHFTQTAVFNGEKTDIDQMIFVCPIWFLVLVLVTLVTVAAFVIRSIVRRIRK